MDEGRLVQGRWDLVLRGRTERRWKNTAKESLRCNNMPDMYELGRVQMFRDRGSWKKRLISN